jgi:neutral ceramidase
MSGRRIQQTIFDGLTGTGGEDDIFDMGQTRNRPETVIISGLTNGYCGYLATREEYSLQHYEGASTHFGPNQLAATQQVFHQLAGHISRRSRPVSTATIPAIEDKVKINWGLGVVFDGVLLTKSFGDAVDGKDVDPSCHYEVGSCVECTFHAGHPKNDFRTQRSFLAVQKKDPHSQEWGVVEDDGSDATTYRWARKGLDASHVTISWTIFPRTVPGVYRLTHTGNYKSGWTGKIFEYTGASKPFHVLLKSPKVHIILFFSRGWGFLCTCIHIYV